MNIFNARILALLELILVILIKLSINEQYDFN